MSKKIGVNYQYVNDSCYQNVIVYFIFCTSLNISICRFSCHLTSKYKPHRRRIYTEEKAQVVSAVWGTEFIQFLATRAILQFGEKDEFFLFFNSSLSSYHPGAKQLAR